MKKFVLTISLSLLAAGPVRAAVESGEDIAAHVSRNLSVVEERKKTAEERHNARLAEEARINARIDKINALSARQLRRWYESDKSDAALETIAATPDAAPGANVADSAAATAEARTAAERSDTFRQLRLLLVAILGIGLFCYWTWRRAGEREKRRE